MINYTEMIQRREKIIARLIGTKRKGIGKLIEYMNKYDYFSAPASSKFHSNCVGGLAMHSNFVTDLLLEKRQRFDLNVTEEECIIAGYLHDLCKMNMYIKDYKLKKEGTAWVAEEVYKINEAFPIGHGAKSVIIAQQFIKLTPIEILMITYHMGLSLPKEDYRDMNNAKAMCKAITAIQTADMEAADLLEEVYPSKTIDIKEYNRIREEEKEEITDGVDFKI